MQYRGILPPTVHLILTNWKRPDNLDPIVAAFRDSVAKITVMDNSPPGSPPYTVTDLHDGGLVDNVWTAYDNGGPPIRFAPALHDLDHPYTLFWDDDLLPPDGLVEEFLRVANGMPDAPGHDTFGELGIIGRMFDDSGAYVRRNVARKTSPVQVDLCCRAHFMRTIFVPCIYEARQRLTMLGATNGQVNRHDDLLITAACKFTGMGSYLIPAGPRHKDLPAPHALPTTFEGGLDAFVLERSDLFRLIQGAVSHERME